MTARTDRRGFLKGGASALAAVSIPAAAGLVALPGWADGAAAQQRQRPPALDRDLVLEFVRVAHGDLERTKSMLGEEPALLNATWDWGGGDFETALGGASHMGNKEIAAFLLGRGARIDLFCATMMGLSGVVESVIAAYPDAVDWKGPHGISLLRHAEMGEQSDLVAYLKRMGAV